MLNSRTTFRLKCVSENEKESIQEKFVFLYFALKRSTFKRCILIYVVLRNTDMSVFGYIS